MPFKNSISGVDPAKQNVPVPDPINKFEPPKKGYFLKATFHYKHAMIPFTWASSIPHSFMLLPQPA